MLHLNRDAAWIILIILMSPYVGTDLLIKHEIDPSIEIEHPLGECSNSMPTPPISINPRLEIITFPLDSLH